MYVDMVEDFKTVKVFSLKSFFFSRHPRVIFAQSSRASGRVWRVKKTRIFRASPKCYILFLPESSLQVFCLSTPVFLTYVQTEAVLQCGIAGKYKM